MSAQEALKRPGAVVHTTLDEVRWIDGRFAQWERLYGEEDARVRMRVLVQQMRMRRFDPGVDRAQVVAAALAYAVGGA
jgi:hypothetical protein